MEQYADEAALAEAPDTVRRSVMHLLSGLPWALSYGVWPVAWAGATNARALALLSARPTLLALATPRHLCSLLSGLAASGAWVDRHGVRVILEEVRAAPEEEMTASAWADVLHCCARLRFHDWPLIDAAAAALAAEGGHAGAARLSARQVTRVATALCKLKYRDKGQCDPSRAWVCASVALALPISTAGYSGGPLTVCSSDHEAPACRIDGNRLVRGAHITRRALF